MKKPVIDMVEKGLVPDFLSRIGVRALCRKRLKEEIELNALNPGKRIQELVEALKSSPIALVPDTANEQHYEVPPEFFQYVLGKHLKYSGCLWNIGTSSINEAEEAMLDLSCERAELLDGMDILELGCGWGSFTLWAAEHYPNSRITALSNSADQKNLIRTLADKRGLNNIEVITADMNDFDIDRRFDRVMSVEMFEHMRNYKELLRRISGWLKSDGKLFVHIFCHREVAYPFEIKDDSDWMSRYFFTGGLMPSFSLLSYFQDDLTLVKQWQVDGTHYQRSANAWLENLDNNKSRIMLVFEKFYGPGEARLWFIRWRLFFIACEELFGYRKGSEWMVGHYLFSK
jgi:cyclopropane-fatty-acyl-phospholipid synthase